MSNFIWDADGTIIDSYDVIVKSLFQICEENNIDISPDEIRRIILVGSVGDLYQKIVSDYKINISLDTLRIRYKTISDGLYKEITPMKGVIETLEGLVKRGDRNFVVTHRDNLTFDILKNLGMDKYFEDVVTADMNLGWKPNPGGVNYLIEKYSLDRSESFYVGDRTIDVLCGFNANIGSILFKDENSCVSLCGKETFVVSSLPEILNLKV